MGASTSLHAAATADAAAASLAISDLRLVLHEVVALLLVAVDLQVLEVLEGAAAQHAAVLHHGQLVLAVEGLREVGEHVDLELALVHAHPEG